MKFNININQYELSKNKDITIQDSAIIDWLFTICGSDSAKIDKQRVGGWTWISLTHLIDDMPLLRIKTPSGASKMIKRIKLLGYIDTMKSTKERKLYVKPTSKLRDLYFSNQVPKKESQVLEESSQVPKDTYHNTINNNTNIITTNEQVVVYEFSFIEEMQKLRVSNWLPNKIIFNYWTVKGFVFHNKKQFDSAYRRELRPAKALEGYTSEQINKGIKYCQENYTTIPWTLETVGKRILDIVNKK